MKKSFTIVVLACFLFPMVFAINSNIWHEFSDKHSSVEEALKQCEAKYNLSIGSKLLLTRTVEDNIGMTHYTYQQFVDGIKVEGCYILVHMRDNVVTSINGRLLEANDLPKERTYMPRKQIIKRYKAIKENNLEQVIFEFKGLYYSAYKYYDVNKCANIYIDSKNGDLITEISLINYADANGTAFTRYSGWQNIVYDNTNGLNTLHDNARNIHTYDASNYDGIHDSTALTEYSNPDSEWYTPILTSVTITWAAQSWWYNVLTDANPDFYIKVKRNGVILYESGYYDNTNPPVTFNIPLTIEADGNISIEVCDYDGTLGSDDSAGSVKISNTTAGTYSWNNNKTQATYTISKATHPALDVHWGMEKVYDFYSEKFNLVSYDGQGSPIIQLVNPPSNLKVIEEIGFPNQACALGSYGIMAYGLGDGEICNPLVSIDIMGHEFTHMVTAANGDQNLPNSGEGGALNESFGDIMGNAIEAYAWGEPDWLVGTGTVINNNYHAARSMSAPKSMESPNMYQGSKWQPITGTPTGGKNGNDMDGVHTNCGVQNYWFYLLCNGGSGYIDDNISNEAYTVVGIGMEKAIQIAYRNLMTYITSTSQYADSRRGSIQSAIDLYGRYSQEHQSVMNAWHAVGVGNKYIEIICKDVPYSEPFTSSMGDFDIQIVSKDAGLGTVWKLDASANQYGMVAKSMYNNVHYASEGWLISPHIEIPEDATTTLTFNHAAKFFSSANTEMTLWVSTDYESGLPSTATWTQLTILRYPSGTNWTFVNSGNIDLSAYAGSCVTFAFKYVSTSTVSPQWEIKNISVTSVPNPISGIDEIEQVPKSARKILRNGQLYILRDGKAYDLTGKEVQ